MSHTVKLFERIVNLMIRTIVELGNTHFVFRRGLSTTGSTVERPLLNTKWMLPNCTIVLSMWFIIRSNSFTVWDISFILQKLLHSSMIRFPLNSGVSSLNLHEYGMADVSTASISSLDIQSLVLSSFIILQSEAGLITCLIQLHLIACCFLISSTDIGDTSPSVFSRVQYSCSFG